MFKYFFVEEQRIWSSKKNEKKYFLIFLKTFSLKDEGFRVLKNEKEYFLIFFFKRLFH